MSILYYFKPPQFIPAAKETYEVSSKRVSKRKRKIQKRNVNPVKQIYPDAKDLEYEDEILVLSLMLEGIL